MALFIAAWTLVNLLGFLKRNSKIIFLLQMLFIFVLLGWNQGFIDNADNYAIYKISGAYGFQGFSSGWLFSLLAKTVISNGYSYFYFKVTLAAITVVSVSYVILCTTEQPCLVALLFNIYPLMDSVIQSRFAPGMALSVLALYLLSKKRRVGFVICIALAIGFHFSFIAYFFFALWQLIDSKIQKRILWIGFIVELILIIYGKNILARIFPSAKLQDYLYRNNYSSPIIGVIFMLAMAGYILLFVLLCERDKQFGYETESSLDTSFIEDMNLDSIFIVPVLYMDGTFLRYYRAILILNYIYLANHFGHFNFEYSGKIYIDKNNSLSYLIVGYVILISVGMYVMGYYGLDGYWKNMMTNYIFGNSRGGF